MFHKKNIFILVSLIVLAVVSVALFYTYLSHNKPIANTKKASEKQYISPEIAKITTVGDRPTQDVKLSNGKYNKAMAGEVTAKITNAETVKSFGATAKPLAYLKDTYSITVPPNSDLLQASAEIKKKPGVVYAEPNYVVTAQALPRSIPNDPWVPITNNLNQISAFEGWAVSLAGVTIAVVDTGANPNEPDLAGKIIPGQNFIYPGQPNNIIDDQVESGAPAGNGHGTIVSLTAVANTNNGVRGAGISRQSAVLAIKVMDSNKAGNSIAEAQGISYAVSQGVRVINASINGAPCPDPVSDCTPDSLKTAIQAAHDAGAIVVISSGNNGLQSTNSGASTNTNSIIVGATQDSPAVARSAYSDWGFQVALSAPGRVVINSNAVGDGTSFAAPQVAGAAAMILALRPGLSADAVKHILQGTADGPSPQVGAGRLNLYKALTYTSCLP